MARRNPNIEPVASTPKSTTRLGFWTAVLTAIVTAVSLGIAATTLPQSGPFCPFETCVGYPYTDVAAFVPADYIWIYPALLIGPLFLILVACIHAYAAADKKLFGQIALSFAAISATALATNYFIQLTVMQPSFLKGETEGLALFSQYNPHGVFIALEDIGYLMMGIAFLFAAVVFDGRTRLDRTIRFVFALSGVLAIGALVTLASIYGYDLEYRYEVAVITIDWLTLIIVGILLAFFFRREAAA